MEVIATMKHKKGHIVYHKPGCIYERKILPDNRWSLKPDKIEHSKKFCVCKYCEGLKGDVRVHRTVIAKWEKQKKAEFFFDEKTQTMYIRTKIGCWKFFLKEDIGKYLLYHRNEFDSSIDWQTLIYGEFHRQTDVKPTGNLMKLLEYIFAHDQAKIIIMDDYRKLPRATKQQRKYYRKAEEKERRKRIRTVDSLFAQLEAANPELKALSCC